MSRRKKRRWDATLDGDPLSVLVNLFDLWMVFSIALRLSLVAATRLPHFTNAAGEATTKSVSKESLNGQQYKLDRFRVGREQLTGEGDRLGTAYRLKTGEVVYVPD